MGYYLDQTYLDDQFVDEMIEAIWQSRKHTKKPFNERAKLELRFFDDAYIRQLRQYVRSGVGNSSKLHFQKPIEAVYKNLSSGSGGTSLLRTMRYIARERDKNRASKESIVLLEDQDGKIVAPDDLIALKNSWEERFYSSEAAAKRQHKEYDIFQKIQEEITELKLLDSDGLLGQEDKSRLNDLISGTRTIRVWENGTLVQDIDRGNFGFIVGAADNKVSVEFKNPDTQKTAVIELAKAKLKPIQNSEGLRFQKRNNNNKSQKNIALDDERFYAFVPSQAYIEKNSAPDFRHFILSPGGDLKGADKTKAAEATREFLKTHLGDRGFNYVFATHDPETDEQTKEHLHFHVIVHTKNRFSRKLKLPAGPMESFVFRREYNETLKAHGLSRVATIKKDRLNLSELVKDKEDLMQTKAQRAVDALMKDRDVFYTDRSEAMYKNEIEAFLDDFKSISNIAAAKSEIGKIGDSLKSRHEFNAYVKRTVFSLEEINAEMAKAFDVRMKKLGRELASQKETPYNFNPFISVQLFHEYADMLEESIRDKYLDKLPKKEAQVILDNIKIARGQVDLSSKKKFEESVEGLGRFIAGSSKDVATFWQKTLTEESIQKSSKYILSSKANRAIESQEALQFKLLRSYEGADRLLKSTEDPRKGKRIEKMQDDLVSLIVNNDLHLSYLKDQSPKLQTREKIMEVLKRGNDKDKWRELYRKKDD